MPGSYLKKYYLDDNKLAQRALLEFNRSLRTGRMIGFTGAMATQAFGYGSWDQLQYLFGGLALEALDNVVPPNGQPKPDVGKSRSQVAQFLLQSMTSNLGSVVGMSLIEEVLDQPAISKLRMTAKWPFDSTFLGLAPKTSKHAPMSAWHVPRLFKRGSTRARDIRPKLEPQPWPLDQFATPAEAHALAMSLAFRKPQSSWQVEKPSNEGLPEQFNVPKALWHMLGINRFATASYDFELERVLMLADKSAAQKGQFTSAFEQLREMRDEATTGSFFWDLGSGRIRRVWTDGWAIESDMLNRERIDRMIEFAVGTDDVDGHIMHMHGRACNWRSMIVSQRDYDNLYRRNDLNRAPFELARRMMIGGNPIVFVGLGMTEAELNREMEEFISNDPYRRVAPTFLLWNATASGLNKNERAAKRLDLLSRLGVLTIYDTDLTPIKCDTARRDAKAPAKKAVEAMMASRFDTSGPLETPKISAAAFNSLNDAGVRDDLKDLASLVKNLSEWVTAQGAGSPPPDASTWIEKAPPSYYVRENVIGTHWRSMQPKINCQWRLKKPTSLWHNNSKGSSFEHRQKLVDEVLQNRITCVIGPQGCGKGEAARGLRQHLIDNPATRSFPDKRKCLLINGSFSFDTDSLLDGFASFMCKVYEGQDWADAWSQLDKNIAPEHSRQTLFENMRLDDDVPYLGTQSDALIIMNGMERFFSLDGSPISAELDELLHLVARSNNPRSNTRIPRVRWVLFGTERVRRYMNEIGARTVEFASLIDGDGYVKADPPNYHLQAVASTMGLQEDLDRNFRFTDRQRSYRDNATSRTSGDSIALRKSFFDTLLESRLLFEGLDRAIKNGNEIREKKNKKKIRKKNIELLPPIKQNDIVDVHKVLRMLAFAGTPVEPDVLDTMAGFSRARSKVVCEWLGAANLILEVTGFTCGAKPDPVDRYVLHRALLYELRYRYGIPLNEAKLSTAFNMSLYVAQPVDGEIPDSDIHDDLGRIIDDLIGSYRHGEVAENIKTELLLKAAYRCGDTADRDDRTDQMTAQRMHRLCSPRYVQCLRASLALIRSYYSTTGLLTLDSGDRLVREDRDGILLEHAERLDDLIDAYGKLTLAREFMRDELGNHEFKKVYGAAEPFYPDELVWLHNERGVVRLAMGDLYEANVSFDRAMRVNREWVERNDRGHNWRRIRVNQITLNIEMGEIGVAERRIEELIAVSKKPKPLREDRLATAIATGYRGWCMHLRGRFDRARDDYAAAIETFRKLNEVRAQTYFARLSIGALDRRDSATGRRPDIEAALDLAQSSRQMDLVHRLQIALADQIIFGGTASDAQRKKANRLLDEAIAYALQTDVHRVRCEATMTIAKVRQDSGDFDGALRYAMDSLMIATRYGMELRKIRLRALVAHIMVDRGHPLTAEHLARTCIKVATRHRYQTAIDVAEQVLLSIPRMSSAISESDRSGRRNY
ncbi:tetratricopeptide (TPR) repeat protein [Novosphingobium hassiacum]|uniref:Tetratricopeptide (TPR) repeat protein n=1 Tax=Novosphingobium hassiacum TaxID=173676 RepID=A0A7W6A015_9SPHN|nr:SIR2 family protein [Novosphingobium hassiacum]MBB3860790.1 tetratricopeptide (TPR) repeat protein [Novosphingobium hassiacum]